MKTISVIVPVYNAENTLEKCLLSIAKQTYKNVQVIAMNDGSTDSSEDILRAFCKKDSRFSYVNLEHGGVSHARNGGLEYATGEYLQFTDADDELELDMFEKMITLMEKNDADMSICRFDHPFFKTYVEDEVFDLTKKEELLRLYSDTYAVVMPWNKIWRRRCFVEKFDESVHFSEDELGNLANLPNVKKVVTTKEYLYKYYFAKKEDNAKEESCVNNIINSEAFWNNKTSFYYMGASLLEKRKVYIQRGIDAGKLAIDNADDMAYLRLIDYCFWQMPAYIGMGIHCYGLTAECYHIFSEPDFLYGFKAQEQYGFTLYELDDIERQELSAKFTALCYKAYREMGTQPDFRIAYVFITLFLAIFAEITGELDLNNQNAKLLNDLFTNATPEAIYVNEIL